MKLKILILIFCVIVLMALINVFSFNKKKIETPIENVNQVLRSENLNGFRVLKNTSLPKYLVINFWASWCPPCIEETPSLIKFVLDHKSEFKLIALSQDASVNEINSFLKTFPLLSNPEIEVVWDSNQSLARAFKVEKLPETFVISTKNWKILQVSGSTNWQNPQVIQNIEKHFNEHF